MADTESEEVLGALSSKTRREAYRALFDDPATTSELAARLDTSVQNAHHHLSVLRGVGLVESVETVYSSKGNEMTVYGPANDPLVFVGDEEGPLGDTQWLTDVVSGLALLGVASLLVQWATERVWQASIASPSTVGTASYPGTDSSLFETAAWVLFEVVEPGVFFFVSCLVVVAAIVYVTER